MNPRSSLLALSLLGLSAVPALAADPPAQAQPSAPKMFIASDIKDDEALARLMQALRKVDGEPRVEGRLLEGGFAQLRILGGSEEALVRAAKEAGSTLKVALPLFFRIGGSPKPEDLPKLRDALLKLEGIGPVRLGNPGRGPMLALMAPMITAEKVIAAAKEAGFELQVQTGTPGAGRVTTADGEKIAPAAFAEFPKEDLTKVGEAAPDFTLITQDGKSKVTLSEARSKKPVVLVFGSYT